MDFVSDYASDEISTEYRDAVPNGTQLHQPTRRENLAERSYCLPNFITVSMFLQGNGNSCLADSMRIHLIRPLISFL